MITTQNNIGSNVTKASSLSSFCSVFRWMDWDDGGKDGDGWRRERDGWSGLRWRNGDGWIRNMKGWMDGE